MRTLCLQAVCRKILTDDLSNLYHGVLSEAPSDVSNDLQRVLQQCNDLQLGQLDRSQQLFAELYDLLQKSHNFN